MERKCNNCDVQMIKTGLFGGSGGYVLLEQRKKGILKSKYCGITAYVCPKCGHIELVADEPEIFEQ